MKLYSIGQDSTEKALCGPLELDRKALGRFGEDEASKYLLSEGFEILRRNFRNRFGEVDIIARKGSAVHFIEVKTRRTNSCGYPDECVNGLKKNKILRTALWYLNGDGRAFKNHSIAFDLVAIYIKENLISIKFIEF
ncbi:MAG TPA: YraN family protein [Candidatus Wallbacteria bacterium]|nr:YraN family protein [Candidatus Wallbacteria bacterium]